MTKTIIDILYNRAEHQSDNIAYTFLREGTIESKESITYAELLAKASGISNLIGKGIQQNDRCILIYPPGLEYISAFFGCLLAGGIPVPCYPPFNNNFDVINAIISDSGAKIILSTKKIIGLTTIYRGVKKVLSLWQKERVHNIKWLETDSCNPIYTFSKFSNSTLEQIAFLQYTSGSTGTPKGVTLTHENLMANLNQIKNYFGSNKESYGVIWLPPYHDMGLIGGILQPLYVGFPVILMSPIEFLKKPLNWLKAITHVNEKGYIISGGPNFSYDLCSRKINDKDVTNLKLSNWKLSFNGAEPIKGSTLDKFTNKFYPAGFRKNHFFLVYGLAEGTLMASAGKKQTTPIVKYFDKKMLEQNIAQLSNNASDENQIAITGCGKALENQKLIIVSTDDNIICPESKVGEIWLAGKSIAKGYWNNEELSEKQFSAFTNDGDGPYLRTGDLGFLLDGELFVTGRIKDLIIIRGKNFYPHDIEEAVVSCHPSLRKGCSAVFSCEINHTEELIILQEAKGNLNQSECKKIVAEIIETIVEKFRLRPFAIGILKEKKLPKTSSGKIRRVLVKQLYKEDKIKFIYYSDRRSPVTRIN